MKAETPQSEPLSFTFTDENVAAASEWLAKEFERLEAAGKKIDSIEYPERRNC